MDRKRENNRDGERNTYLVDNNYTAEIQDTPRREVAWLDKRQYGYAYGGRDQASLGCKGWGATPPATCMDRRSRIPAQPLTFCSRLAKKIDKSAALTIALSTIFCLRLARAFPFVPPQGRQYFGGLYDRASPLASHAPKHLVLAETDGAQHASTSSTLPPTRHIGRAAKLKKSVAKIIKKTPTVGSKRNRGVP